MKYKQKSCQAKGAHHDHASPAPGFLATRYPKSWHAQTNYSPVNPAKHRLPELDDSPEAVRSREKAARNSILVPLAAVIGVIAILTIAVLIKTNV